MRASHLWLSGCLSRNARVHGFETAPACCLHETPRVRIPNSPKIMVFFFLSPSLWLSSITKHRVLDHFFEEFGHRLIACLLSSKLFEHDANILVSDCSIQFEWLSLKLLLFPEFLSSVEEALWYFWMGFDEQLGMYYQHLFPLIFLFLHWFGQIMNSWG